MIKGFKDKDTEFIYNQKFSKRLPPAIQKIALRKLMMIHNSKTLEDLRIPPANRLEAGTEGGKHHEQSIVQDEEIEKDNTALG